MMRVAIQGLRASYSAEAANSLFSCTLVECASFKAAIESLRTLRADAAVLPVKNSLTGEITDVVELLSAADLAVTGEIELPVRHVLAACGRVSPQSLTGVVSHPQALLQCNKFIALHKLQKFSAPDTATAVREVARGNDMTLAAIGSKRAAQLFGATIIAEHIADSEDNYTLFYSIARRG
jgi:prephenate dehydratase